MKMFYFFKDNPLLSLIGTSVTSKNVTFICFASLFATFMAFFLLYVFISAFFHRMAISLTFVAKCWSNHLQHVTSCPSYLYFFMLDILIC